MAAYSQYPVTAASITVQPAMYQYPAGFKDQVWSTSLCGCCEDMSTCCLGFWCPACLACQNHSDFGECLCMPLVDCMLCGGLIPATSFAMRTGLRERYRIQGDMCNDCCIVTCCPWISTCQMAREMKNRRQTVLNTTHTTTVYNALPQQIKYHGTRHSSENRRGPSHRISPPRNTTRTQGQTVLNNTHTTTVYNALPQQEKDHCTPSLTPDRKIADKLTTRPSTTRCEKKDHSTPSENRRGLSHRISPPRSPMSSLESLDVGCPTTSVLCSEEEEPV